MPEAQPAYSYPAQPPVEHHPQGSPDATGLLTGMPNSQVLPGTVMSPWATAVPGDCCGPVGGNGPVTYEVYLYTGPSLIVGGGRDISGALKAGWMFGGGGKTLFYDVDGESACFIDLGVSYSYNGGRDPRRIINTFARGPIDPNTGQRAVADQINPFFLRGLHRSSFNFSLGKEWYRSGPANIAGRQGTGMANWRFGPEIGGRWGTAHADLVPALDQFNYQRNHGIYHGFFLGGNVDCEIPFGPAVLFTGVKVHWGYDWMNLIPPVHGDVQSLNILGTVGIRF